MAQTQKKRRGREEAGASKANSKLVEEIRAPKRVSGQNSPEPGRPARSSEGQPSLKAAWGSRRTSVSLSAGGRPARQRAPRALPVGVGDDSAFRWRSRALSRKCRRSGQSLRRGTQTRQRAADAAAGLCSRRTRDLPDVRVVTPKEGHRGYRSGGDEGECDRIA